MVTIEGQKEICPYCHRKLSEESWNSVFESIKMYKSLMCDCGKFITLPAVHQEKA